MVLNLKKKCFFLRHPVYALKLSDFPGFNFEWETSRLQWTYSRGNVEAADNEKYTVEAEDNERLTVEATDNERYTVEAEDNERLTVEAADNERYTVETTDNERLTVEAADNETRTSEIWIIKRKEERENKRANLVYLL